MKNILYLLIIGILVLSGFGTIATIDYQTNDFQIENEIIIISKPTIKETDNYVEINLNEATSILSYPNKPVLPIVTRVYTFPFGSIIKSVDVSFSDENKITLSKEIKTGSKPVFMGEIDFERQEIQKDILVYTNEELYPSDSFNYFTGAGLDGEEHVIYLVVQCYPIRYSLLQNSIYYYSNININVLYDRVANQTVFSDEYDLVIIAPEQFSTELQPLVEHKNNIGVNTLFKTTEEIFSEYDGVDKPEQIKFFIKDALDNFGIKYVLLVGGLNSLIIAQRRDDSNQGSIDWLVPVRYTNVNSGPTDDPGYISDLYYADIYDIEGNFSSWDSDRDGISDGIFAAWKYGASRDILDLYPDVYVGRLPCRNIREVNTMVNKIINYESSVCDPSWFNKMVVIGGDTFNGGVNEGEIENQKALDYMNGFEDIKLWTSNRETGGLVPEPDIIVDAISDGCGFLYFAGHGSPEVWFTYYDAKEESTEKCLWLDLAGLSNDFKLPVCVVGSCHGSQFNVTALSFINLYLHRIAEKFGWDWLDRWGGNCGFPTPECFNWVLTRAPNGGPIATIGNTGIGIGAVGGNNDDKDGDGIIDPDCVEVYGGYIESLFFKMYGEENIDILGETWGQAITSYLNVYPCMQDRIDLKTVEQWALFGDPSLKIGGYP